MLGRQISFTFSQWKLEEKKWWQPNIQGWWLRDAHSALRSRGRSNEPHLCWSETAGRDQVGSYRWVGVCQCGHCVSQADGMYKGWEAGIESFTGKGLFSPSASPQLPTPRPCRLYAAAPQNYFFSPNKAFLDLLEEELNIFSNADLPSFKGLPVLILCLFLYCLPC